MEVTYDSKRLFTEPYVKIRQGTKTSKTKVYKGGDKNYGGKFFEKFNFQISGPTGFTFEVYDEDIGRDDYLGSATVNLTTNPNGQPAWYTLTKGSKTFGKIQVQLTLKGAVPMGVAPMGVAPVGVAPMGVAPVGVPMHGHPQPMYHQPPVAVVHTAPMYNQPKTRVNKKGKVKKLKLKNGKWTSSSSDSLSDILKKGLKKLF